MIAFRANRKRYRLLMIQQSVRHEKAMIAELLARWGGFEPPTP